MCNRDDARISETHRSTISQSGMEECATRRTGAPSQCVWRPPWCGRKAGAPPPLLHATSEAGRCVFLRRCPSVNEPACSDAKRRGAKKKKRFPAALEAAPADARSHGRCKANAVTLGDRPGRQDRSAENPRAHMDKPFQQPPDRGFFRKRCRPKVAAADPHQRRMILDTVRMRACICETKRCSAQGARSLNN